MRQLVERGDRPKSGGSSALLNLAYLIQWPIYVTKSINSPMGLFTYTLHRYSVHHTYSDVLIVGERAVRILKKLTAGRDKRWGLRTQPPPTTTDK